MPRKRSPLFKTFNSLFNYSARDKAKQLSNAVDEVYKGRKPTNTTLAKLSKTIESISQGNPADIKQSELFRIAEHVDKYARKGLKDRLLDLLFSKLGPVGSILQGLIRPGSAAVGTQQQEIDAAVNLLKQFGYGVKKPGTVEAPSSPSTDKALEMLEALGWSVKPPEPPQAKPPKRRPQDTADEHVVTIQHQRYRIKKNDPLVTGEMVLVESSNVHSIGYIWNDADPGRGTLKVRFLDKRKNGPASGRGAMYYYFDVHPTLFQAFQKAASKGKWVWDNLRIRGTVSGHQKRYQLMSLASDGYVPRQATRFGNEEWYIRRTVKSAAGKSYTSELGDQLVRRVNRGRGNGPNRGRPGNGAPNRGR